MKVLVLLSGGQDSTTVLYYALRKYGEVGYTGREYSETVETISFAYGQRHAIELEGAREIAAEEGVRHTILPVEALAILGGASLTSTVVDNTPGGAPALSGWHAEHRLPPSFVPGRNLLFFTLAAAYAIPRGIKTIVTGVCQQDRAGYPDCRSEFVMAMTAAIALGMDERGFVIDAPLLNRSKAETWALAAELGVLDTIIERTHTCYEGDRDHRHVWGYGCGSCGACIERARGFSEFHEWASA